MARRSYRQGAVTSFVIDSKSENRDGAVEAVESVSEARAVQGTRVRIRV